MWCKLCYYAGHVEKYTEQQIYKMLTFIVLRANKGGRVTIDVHGKENIPEKDGFMFFPNHQGMYDVLAIVEACSHPFSVVAKKEVENVQFLKQVFKCMKAYTMDRSDVRQAMKVITAVSKEVENGRNYLIFPEGTRSKNGNHVQEFKGGSFKAATKAKCPIIPVCLCNTENIFENNLPWIKKGKILIEYGKPIYPEELNKETKKHLGVYVRGIIEEMYEENRKKIS